jgi:hypothetical protein
VSASDNIAAAFAVIQNRGASSAELKACAPLARSAIRLIDAENELSPQREAEILARMAAGVSLEETFSALGRLDDDAISCVWQRKIAVALAAQLDERRLHARAQRESQLQALFARAAAE